MSCYICGNEVVEPVVRPDSEEYPCPDCGHYRISGTAMELFRLHDWKFDIYLVRRWIADQQGSGEIPLIDSGVASLLFAAPQTSKPQ